MTTAERAGVRAAAKAERGLRLWPGVVLVVALWLLRFAVPAIESEAIAVGVLAALLGGPAFVLWWLFFSRARGSERWVPVALAVLVPVATVPFLHESIATGMQGFLFPVYVTPLLCLAWLGWAMTTRRAPQGVRRAALVPCLIVACGGWTLVRTGGFTSDLDQDFAWRWSATREERLLERAVDEAFVGPVSEPDPARATWPGFRGHERDGLLHGARIEPDWSAAPPVLLWKRAIGPGWSSFAVGGGRAYTQEQRGDEEAVSCYELQTGMAVWRHADAVRFWESNAGAGPRATPTLHEGRIFALGATGILNALAAHDGSLLWSRDAAAETGAKVPEWGFAGSPLVTGELVVAALAGTLAAFDLESGEPRWIAGTQAGGYSSPQLATIDGVEQLLFISGSGIAGHDAAGGAILWEHAWPGDPIVQPAQVEGGDVLVSVGATGGVRRLGVARQADGWSVTERWTSIRLKPYFNDLVVHEGFAYGFDGGILACIDLADGSRRWKDGRYGRGQLVLLVEQGLLLVLSEEGGLALV